MTRKDSSLTVTDMFCGAGGSSQGARRKGLSVQLAMNHWQLAIQTHNSNFPETEHDCADLRVAHPGRYWATNILLASPECTNHSVAKGVKRRVGQLSLLNEEGLDPSAVRSRATMWTVPEYAEHHNYDLIIVENVVDARKWRPWDGWIKAMHGLGYAHETVYLNSMFAHLSPLANPRYGDFAPQSRDRLYVVFWKKGNKKPDLEIRPLAHCPKHGDIESVQSWKKGPGTPFWKWGRYGQQYVYRCPQCGEEVMPYYYAAANAIDWALPVERIGDRRRPLKERTLARIQRGLEMFAGQQLLINLGYSHGHDNRSVPIFRSALPTQTAMQSAALLGLPFTIETLFTSGDRQPRPVDEALATQTTRQSTAVIMPFMPFVLGYANDDSAPRAADGPLRTVTTNNLQAITIPPFLMSLNHSTDRHYEIDGPLATQMPHVRNSLITPPFLLGYANQEGPPKGVDEPMRTFHTENGQALVMPPFITYLRGTNSPKGMDEALDTVAASGNHHGLTVPPFLMSYYGDNANHRAVDREMGTVVTVDRHALVQPDTVEVDDCGFRMLEPHEISRGMAFDDNYIVLGNKREQVRQLGNAVTPPATELLLERCVASLM